MWQNLWMVATLIVVLIFTATASSAEITGIVMLHDGDRVTPAAGVHVLAETAITGIDPGTTKAAAVTDTDGRFNIRDTPLGHCKVRLQNRGFGIYVLEKESPFRGYVFPRDPVEIDTREPGPHVVEFILQRAATIKGRAIRNNNQPIDWAMVGIVGGNRFGNFERGTGHFIIYGVPPGGPQRVLVTATAPEEYIYGQYIDLNAEQLKPGETVDVGTIRFDPLPPESNLKGTMTDADGNATTGMRIYPLVHTSLPIQTSLVVIEGKIDQALLPGEYKMVTGRDPNHVLAEITVQAQGITEVKLQDNRPVKQEPDDMPE